MNLRDTSKLLYQLKLANQKMTALFEQDTGFSITRYELLLFLRESGPCSQTVLQTQLQCRGDSAFKAVGRSRLCQAGAQPGEPAGGFCETNRGSESGFGSL